MTIEVRWGDEAQTHIYAQFTNTWDWVEYHTAIEEWQRLTTVIPHKVANLVDLTQSATLPRGAMNIFGKTAQNIPANTDLFIIIGGDSLLCSVLTATQNIYPHPDKQLVFVTTPEEAYSYLYEHHH